MNESFDFQTLKNGSISKEHSILDVVVAAVFVVVLVVVVVVAFVVVVVSFAFGVFDQCRKFFFFSFQMTEVFRFQCDVALHRLFNIQQKKPHLSRRRRRCRRRRRRCHCSRKNKNQISALTKNKTERK